MLFNTPEFIIFFIIVLAVIAVIRLKLFQHLFLLGASYFFFYFSSNFLITLLIFSTLLDFYVGKAIFSAKNQRTKKILLLSSLAGNLGLLGFFKYADFGISQINQITDTLGFSEIPALELILPIGISFYTFQTISYTVDIYRGKLTPSKSLVEFALFVSFFPQLVAGPILRAHEFLPQLREKINNKNIHSRLRTITIHDTALRIGITLMAMGFFKKMFFADNIAPMVDEIFAAPYGLESFSVVLGAIAFGVQIYCDFSGYSDIAIGAAMILGFNIPANFNKPYFATSPIDFWRRWHISLSSWLRDYLYIPLGGNRKGDTRTYVNLITVMLLGGLWHGASWNFIVWGLMHGLYLAVQKLIMNKFPKLAKSAFVQKRHIKIISILATQYFVFMAWLAFRVQDIDALSYVLYKYVIWDFATSSTIQMLSHNKLPILLIVGFFILNYISYKTNIVEKLSQIKPIYWIGFLISIMVLILFFYDTNPRDFIYFRF
ncbi:MAG: alginate O-acetyltransferase [Thaumarchaeota archaeon]|jgi:alginate O-acetyltransferase complex protein AlgI|nr:MAG: alginate O-acetyltransferase [Nitrososphaerota archaeon]